MQEVVRRKSGRGDAQEGVEMQAGTALRAGLGLMALAGLGLGLGGCQLIAGLGGEKVDPGTGGGGASAAGGGGAGGGVVVGPWARAFEGAVEVTGVAVDKQGNVFVVGNFSGGVKFDDGAPIVPYGISDIFLLKLKPDGSSDWTKRFGDTADQKAYAITIDTAGDVAITGFSDSSINFGTSDVPAGIFVAKFDNSGKSIWSIGGGGDIFVNFSGGTGLAVDSNNDIIAIGQCHGAIAFPGTDTPTPTNSGNDIFVAKLASSDGKSQWVRRSKGLGVDRISGVSVDSSNSILVTGTTTSAQMDLVPGDFYNCCRSDEPGAPFIEKLGPDGSLAVADMFAGYSTNFKGTTPRAITVNALGESFVAGDFSGTFDLVGAPSMDSVDSAGGHDAFIARAEPHVQWIDSFGDSTEQTTNALIRNSAGYLLAAGTYQGTIKLGDSTFTASANSTSIFLTTIDRTGTYITSKNFGGSTKSTVSGLTIGPDDSVFLAGTFKGSLDLGSSKIAAPEGGAFVARLDP